MTEKKTSTVSEKKNEDSAENLAAKSNNKNVSPEREEQKPLAKKPTSAKVAHRKATQQPVTTVTSSTSKSGILALILSIIAIAGIGGHYYWQTQQHQILIEQLLAQNESQQQSSERQVLDQVSARQSQLAGELTTNITQLLNDSDTKLQSLAQRVEGLSQNQPSDWLMHEAEYLIRIASRSLWLEKDTVAAISLLQDADARLSELNDPSLLPVRQVINQDIEQLKLQPKLATEETILTLMAMAEQIKQLPIAMAHLPGTTEPEQPFTLSENTDDWRENITKSWQRFLDSFITVKRRTANVEALLTPQQQQSLTDNLYLKLQLAQWAASQQKAQIYQKALQDAQHWISEYFDTDHNATMQFTQQLSRLQSAVINLALPAKLQSLQAIRRQINQQNTVPNIAENVKEAVIDSAKPITSNANKDKQDGKPNMAEAAVNAQEQQEEPEKQDNNGAML
ncbi:uroporphyrinogen-III C-methyltransferase [Thalassotalea atypica]|uniref:uroporphyrinogen-III C-methyltransferase n=1 Tax=Thalassotalea atypica TaxID=2054316 RepID=UPI0025732F5B|nr:uroporphyrinogen-III C-methyltransferase [Thalassotalea atypica]